MRRKRLLHRVLRGLLALTALSLWGGAYAANFRLDCYPKAPNEPCALVLEGPIVSGDALTLEATLAALNAANNSFVRWLVLNSPGGNVLEAIRIAEVVRNRLLWTTNLNIVRYGFRSQEQNEAAGHTCASSCFLVLMAGGNRILVSNPESRGRIGLHRPFYDSKSYANLSVGEAALRQQDAEDALRAFARRERVPENLVDEMMSRSSTEVYWLTRKDIVGLGGYATWFEELKIALCGWDKPGELQAWGQFSQATDQAQKRRIGEGISAHTREVQACVDEKTLQAQQNFNPTRKR